MLLHDSCGSALDVGIAVHDLSKEYCSIVHAMSEYNCLVCANSSDSHFLAKVQAKDSFTTEKLLHNKCGSSLDVGITVHDFSNLRLHCLRACDSNLATYMQMTQMFAYVSVHCMIADV